MTNSVKDDQNTTSINPNDDLLLSVKGVSKKFCRSLKKSYVYGLKDIFAELFGISRSSDQLRKNEFWSLKDINLELKRGSSLGLIGVNGSGKTTLMRTIGGLLKPDQGVVRIRGRVATLNVLGAGFNPLLSGRENVYINMSILGLSKKEIDQNFDQVLEFAEVWDAIDSPVRTYSSGMKSRLGFACAIHTNPELLLIDEVLAVGDMGFRVKCYRKLAELREQGTSFVMVSHSPNVILKTCDYAIHLHKGRLITSGDSATVMKKYDEYLLERKKERKESIELANPNQSTVHKHTELMINSVCLKNQSKNIVKKAISGQPISFCIHCTAEGIDVKEVAVGVLIKSLKEQGDWILNLSSDVDNVSMKVYPGENVLVLDLPYCVLPPGLYSMKISIFGDSFYVYDLFESFKFEVISKEVMSQCSFYQPRNWKSSRSG